MKIKKLLTFFSVGLASIMLLAGCGTQEVSSNQSQDVVIVGTNAEFEPFEFREDGNIIGFDVEIAQEIARKLGRQLKIEDMAFDTLVMALGSDKVDFVIAGMTATEERATQVDFSDPYFTSKQGIIVRADETNIKNGDDLIGKKVGVQLGTTGDLFVSDMSDVEVVQFAAGTQAVADLKNGKIDAVVIDMEPAKRMTVGRDELKLLDTPFIEEEYAIAVQKGDNELLTTINNTLTDMKEDGTYDAIYAKYFDTAQ